MVDDFSKRLRFGALAKTLTSILEDSNSPQKIDFMSLDVEGAELAVLLGLDFDRYHIKYILVECRDIDALQVFLSSKKYTLIEKLSYHDYLFARISG